MAMSGSFSTGAYSDRTCVFNWSATNNGNRTATISWSVTGGGSYSGYIYSGPVYAWANGSQILNRTDRFELWQGTVVGSGSFNIDYDNAGNARFIAAVNAAIYSGSINVYSGDIWSSLDNIGYILPTNVSVAIASSSRTGLAITRTWTNATECNYNIGGQGWQTEGSTLNGIYCNADTISGLQPNKAYTVQIRFRNGTSAWVNSNTVTGTTTGNIPTITSHSIGSLGSTSASVTYQASYDTNASYSSVEVQYGTTTSYGTSITTVNMTSLTPNTTYYYRIRVKDNRNRVSAWSTGSFKTHPTTVTIVNPRVTDITSTSCIARMESGSPSTTDRSEYSLYLRDRTTKVQPADGHNGTTPAVYQWSFDGLTPNTEYSVRFNLRTVRSNVWAGVKWVDFETPSDVVIPFVKVIPPTGEILNKIGDVESGSIQTTDGVPVHNNARFRTANFLEVKEGQYYTIKASNINNCLVYLYDENQNYMGILTPGQWQTFPYSFLIPTEIKYIKVTFRNSNDAVLSPPYQTNYNPIIYNYYKNLYAIYKETIIDNIQPEGDNSASGITYSMNTDGNLEVVSTAGNGNWLLLILGSNYEDIIENSLSENDKFTISFEMRSPNHTKVPTVFIKTGMGYYQMQGTMNTTFSIMTYTGIWSYVNPISLLLGFGQIIGTTIIKNLKVEKHIKKEIPKDKVHLIE